MTKPKRFEPSDAELEILQVLWQQQPVSVKETVDELVSALAATRSHLDGLAQAVQKAKKG